MYVVTWAGARSAGPASAGGKGWNLGRLHRYGFPVPAGGVVCAEAYRQFLNHPDLREEAAWCSRLKAEQAVDPDVVPRLERFREKISQTSLPAAVAGELHAYLAEHGLLDRPVAVRSSATAEDSALASFAGIHHSFLNVTGLAAIVEAVKNCYASLWTPQAVAYRRRMDLPDEAVAAAVVILAMVDAKSAGVAFSCDPRSGRLDRYTLSASRGLGEAVVSGLTEPDEYVVNIFQYPPVAETKRIGRKAQMTVARAEGGTELVQVSETDASRPALTDEQIAELTMLVGRVHDSLGAMQHPQDVEWAHDGSQFWLLQARPVTNLPPATFAEVAGQTQFWSNANLKDVMPGVQSALGWSFFRSGIDTLIAAPLQAGGYPYPGGTTWIRLFQGRAYFNLTAMQWAFYDAFGIAPAEVNRIMGGHQPEIPVPPATFGQKLRRSLIQLRMINQTARALKRAPEDFQRLWNWSEQSENRNLDALTNRQVLDLMFEVKALMEDFLPRFQLINTAAAGTHQEVIKLLTPVFGERAAGLTNAMLAGATSITSAEQGVRLIRLGNKALTEEKTRAYFTDPNWEPNAWAERLQGTRFKADFDAYLHDYGHRGVYELEPMNPRWKEDPAYLLETVRAQLLSGREIHLEGQAEKREAAMKAVFGKLGFGPLAWRVRYFLHNAAVASAHREMAKSMIVKVAGVSRYVGLAVGRRMMAEGLLDTPGDIFHLSWVDLDAYLQGRSATGFRELAADRKSLREENLLQEPPDVILGEKPLKKAPPPEATGPVLTGMGVASGRAAGAARVVRHPHEGSRLQPGEVLVAPSTDPAWTPLFLRASAIVMEVGGYLSHGAIVAREYGLPAVVNIPGLLQTVKDGEELTVDGDEGKVYRKA